MASNSYTRTAMFRDNAPLSCEGVTSVDGFQIEGTQPTNTDRRIVFSYGDASNADSKYYKLVITAGVAALLEVLNGNELNAENILLEGNTVEELESVTSIPDWVGKTIYPIVALSAPEEQSAVPTLKLAIKTTNNTAQYEKTEDSPIYVLAENNIDIISISSADIEKTGNGSAVLQVRFRDNNTWGNFMDSESTHRLKRRGLPVSLRLPLLFAA